MERVFWRGSVLKIKYTVNDKDLECFLDSGDEKDEERVSEVSNNSNWVLPWQNKVPPALLSGWLV